ncbi:hypothetical protein QYF61_025141 [Mycteria americana]|uniref:Uncharacterized protein n=1 Tax=Mycteria americana TaxID=33587 RepID=A0AAN7SEF2_MYCAM|nr:hypothetical protein QYF61_025141 [Mycteria americana]
MWSSAKTHAARVAIKVHSQPDTFKERFDTSGCPDPAELSRGWQNPSLQLGPSDPLSSTEAALGPHPKVHLSRDGSSHQPQGPPLEQGLLGLETPGSPEHTPDQPREEQWAAGKDGASQSTLMLQPVAVSAGKGRSGNLMEIWGRSSWAYVVSGNVVAVHIDLIQAIQYVKLKAKTYKHEWRTRAHALSPGPETDMCSPHSREDQACERGRLFRNTMFHRALSWWNPNPSHHVVRPPLHAPTLQFPGSSRSLAVFKMCRATAKPFSCFSTVFCKQQGKLATTLQLLQPHSCQLCASKPITDDPNEGKHTLRYLSKPLLKGWRLNHFPGKPVPMLDNPFSEEIFPNIQSKPPPAQLEAISSRPIACYLGEETDPHLPTASFQAVVESDKVSPQPPFLQAKQPQLPQPLLIRLVLQTLHQLRCPSLDTLQPLNVSLVVGGPKLNTVFEVRPHQCRVQGHDHFPSPAGHTIPDTSQDAVGFLGHLGTLLAHIQPAIDQYPQVLLCWAAFQPLFPKPVVLHGVVVTQVQDPALGLVKPHTIDLGPSIQPVQVPLQSLPTLKQINTPTQLGVICKLTEGALDPLIQIIDKDIKQDWPQY